MPSIGRTANKSAFPPRGSRYVATTQPPSRSIRSATGVSSGVTPIEHSPGSRPVDFDARFRRPRCWAGFTFAFFIVRLFYLLDGPAEIPGALAAERPANRDSLRV